MSPDILSSAKGIGGGFPMGACLATANAAKGMTLGSHGTTFGGNPLAMAVGNAVLDVILAPGFLEQVKRKGLLLKQRLASLNDRHPDIVAEIRGEGLMMGIKTRVANTEFVKAALAQKIILIGAGDNVVRLLPPLIVSDEEISQAMERLEAVCTVLEAGLKTEAQRGAAL